MPLPVAEVTERIGDNPVPIRRSVLIALSMAAQRDSNPCLHLERVKGPVSPSCENMSEKGRRCA